MATTTTLGIEVVDSDNNYRVFPTNDINLGLSLGGVAEFNPSSDVSMRTIGVHLIGPVIPATAIIKRVYVEAIVAQTSGGAATVALGTNSTGQVASLQIATAFDAPPYNPTSGTVPAYTVTTPIDTPATFIPALAGAAGAPRQFQVTVANAALTAGRFILHYELDVGRS